MSAKNKTPIYSTSIPTNETITGVQERQQDINLWDSGDYYFLFKKSSNLGTIYIENYQLSWLSNED